MSIDLSSLNENQKYAVAWQDGPLLVLAGPGSGKTRVLTHRIARLIQQSPKARFRVLGVTFTNKAASEMRNRIDAVLSVGRDRATITTFHSFAAEILRQHGSHIGLKPDFAILSEQADREAILADALRGIPREDDELDLKAAQLLPTINRLADECVPVSSAEEWLRGQPHATLLASLYESYRARLIETNQMDFATLLAATVDLLESKPALAKQIRRVYSYVCVDECQDTNSAQYRLLLQTVAETSPNLFVVADDDQLIYQWNGASPSRLDDLSKRFSMGRLQLPENYRCPPQVIDLANSLIRYNSDRPLDKVPQTAKKQEDGKDRVTVSHLDDFEAERLYIAQRLKEIPATERPHCAILARRKKLLEETVTTLQGASIPAYIAIRRTEFQSAPYRWLHATLRLANAPQAREQLRRLTRAFFELEGVNIDVEEVTARAALDQSGFLRPWIEVAATHRAVEECTRQMLETATAALVDRLDYGKFVGAAEAWFEALQARTPAADDEAFVDFEEEREIWEALRSEISGHYQLSELSLHNYLQELDLRAKEKPAPKDAVRCLTIAASKGLEFRHVFLIGLVEDELPGYYARKKGDDSDDMCEERRNCFVAITRAEETLTLTFADNYFGRSKEPSRFLEEMNCIPVDWP